MISYKPFYDTLYRKQITEYQLIFKQGFSANTLYRMKKGEAISTKTLDALCYALDCEVQDILKFVKSKARCFAARLICRMILKTRPVRAWRRRPF